MKKMKISGKDVFDIILSGLLVNDAPGLLAGMTGKQFSGITEDLVGGGVGVLVGTMTKKPLVTNASLAIAVFNIINGMIVGQVESFLPSVTESKLTTTKPTNKKAPMVSVNDYVSMPALSEYTSGYGSGVVAGYSTYKDAYRQN